MNTDGETELDQKTEEEENKGPSCKKTGKKNKKRESQYYIPTGHLLVILEKILGKLFRMVYDNSEKKVTILAHSVDSTGTRYPSFPSLSRPVAWDQGYMVDKIYLNLSKKPNKGTHDNFKDKM